MKKRILHLNVYRKYFNQILSGRKRYEFRTRTPYWEKRLLNREYDEVWIANGYKKNRPEIRLQFIKTHSKTLKGISFFAVELGTITFARIHTPTLGEAILGAIKLSLKETNHANTTRTTKKTSRSAQ